MNMENNVWEEKKLIERKTMRKKNHYHRMFQTMYGWQSSPLITTFSVCFFLIWFPFRVRFGFNIFNFGLNKRIINAFLHRIFTSWFGWEGKTLRKCWPLFSRYWSWSLQIGFIFGNFVILGSNSFSTLCFLSQVKFNQNKFPKLYNVLQPLNHRHDTKHNTYTIQT